MEPPKSSENPHRFDHLLEEQIPRLRRYALALTRDASRADDLVQGCLMRAWAKQHLWQPGTDLRAWLFTILHNQHVNDIRRSVREESEICLDQDMINAIPDYRMNNEFRMVFRDLSKMIEKLPEEQRRTIGLVGYYGMSYEAAAEYEGVPVGTIRSRLSRGREALVLLMEGGILEQADHELLAWAKG